MLLVVSLVFCLFLVFFWSIDLFVFVCLLLVDFLCLTFVFAVCVFVFK